MRATFTSRPALEAASRELFQRQMERQREVSPDTEAPPPVNGAAVRALEQARVYVFHRRKYRVPPIPYQDGLALHELMVRFVRGGTAAALRPAYAEAAAICHRMFVPIGVFGRILHRLTPNPFQRATEQELGEALDFLWLCRTGLRFLPWAESQASARALPTSPATSTSSKPSGNGSRARGRTTYSG